MVKLDVKKSNNLYFDHGQPQRNRISPTVRKNKKKTLNFLFRVRMHLLLWWCGNSATWQFGVAPVQGNRFRRAESLKLLIAHVLAWRMTGGVCVCPPQSKFCQTHQTISSCTYICTSLCSLVKVLL